MRAKNCLIPTFVLSRSENRCNCICIEKLKETLATLAVNLKIVSKDQVIEVKLLNEGAG